MGINKSRKQLSKNIAEGSDKESNNLKSDHMNMKIIKVNDSSPVDQEYTENDLESSLDVIAASYEMSQSSTNQDLDDANLSNKFALNRQGVDKSELQTDRNHTITPEIPVNTTLPDINTSITSRNNKMVIPNNKKGKRRMKAIGKPPL